MGKYFGTDGFRGKAGADLTSLHAFKIGRFLGWHYSQAHTDGERAKIIIGKDTRRSSYMFEYSLDNQKNNSDIAEQDEYSILLSLISEQGENIDDIIRNINLPTERVLTMIVELELDNKIIRLPGNKIAKA